MRMTCSFVFMGTFLTDEQVTLYLFKIHSPGVTDLYVKFVIFKYNLIWKDRHRPPKRDA